MLKFVVLRHKLISLTSVFMLGTDAQMPNVSYMIRDLSSDLDIEKYTITRNLSSVSYQATSV